jgi:hypothetical protein
VTDFFTRIFHLPDYYFHVLINPLPIYGLAVALLGLLIACILRSRPAQITALILVLLTSLAAWPAIEFGEAAYDVMLSRSDNTGADWLKEHKERADKFEFSFYVLAAMAAAALFLPLRWKRTRLPLTIAVLLGGMVVLALAGYIAYPAGRVRHSELRLTPPPKQF